MNPEKPAPPRNWNSIIVDAMMCRVSSPAPGIDAIVLPRTLFDELLRIAEVASRVQNVRLPSEMTIQRREDAYEVRATDPLTGSFEVTDCTLFGALEAAGGKVGAVIQEHLR